MSISKIRRATLERIRWNNYGRWRVERVIYRMCSATARFNYELSKAYERARREE